jgi:DNA adenine methylase
MPSNFILKDSLYYQTYFLDVQADPFVKWAGGKRQILDEIHNYLPKCLENKKITYIEPFVGGGAVYFSLFKSPNITQAILIDINPILIITYKTIKQCVDRLISRLYYTQREYKKYNDKEYQSNYYYQLRDDYNDLVKRTNFNEFNNNWINLSAMFIFLNRTCFNGLYRVNSSGEFNVPRGSYKNPKICDADNLFHVSKALRKAEIYHADFEEAEKYIDHSTFLYLDPPYRASNSSSFTSYTKSGFDESEQIRLAKFCKRIDDIGAKFLLSNSAPDNIDSDDNFFNKNYKEFKKEIISARRNINSNGNDRGEVSELLIMNY